jgi:putative transcriptional regulator
MRDPNFEGTVVLLCQHDGDGALGVIVNRPAPFTIQEVIAQLDAETEAETGPVLENQVLWGGPVERGAGFVIFRGEVPEESGWNLPDEVAVSPSREQLQRLIAANEVYHLCLGYAGWGPGQLEQEITTGSWLYTEVDVGLVLTGDVEARYESALSALGLSKHQVWMQPVDE